MDGKTNEMKGWKKNPDGTLTAVRHFDIAAILKEHEMENERKRLELQRQKELEREKELERHRKLELSMAEPSIAK